MDIDRNRDQRKSYRCVVDETRRQCELKVGSCATPAKLLDESAGGFSVLVNHPHELTLNQTVEIRVVDDWFHARIVHIQEINPTTKGKTDPQDTEPGHRFRLGLRRLGNAELPDQSAISRLADALRFRPGQRQSSGTMSMIIFGVLLAVVAVAVPLGIISTGWRIRLPKNPQPLKQNVQKNDSAAKSKSPSGTPPPHAAPSPVDAGANRSAFGNDHAFGPNGGRTQAYASLSTLGSERRDSMFHLPGAAPFVLPEVINRLTLTAAQQTQIKQLIETTSKAIRLDWQSQGMQRQELSRRREELLDQARRQVLDLLTDQQRTEWQKLSSEQ